MKHSLNSAIITLSALILPSVAHASTASSGMPWEGPLQTIASSLQGPVLAAVLVIGIIGCAAAFAMREAGTGFRWMLGLVGGGAIGAAGLSMLTTMGITTSLI
jgi:type IV secretory pathway VirB2 component (pilin)